MKKIRNLGLIVLSLFLTVGCSMGVNNAKGAVESYLDNYKNIDDNVATQIDELIEKEDLSKEQEKTYKEILERQYKDMKYEITNEVYDKDTAVVTAKITVYDYYKVQQDIAQHLKDNREEFYTDGVYDENLYLDYKLKTMKDYDKTVTYTIEFDVTKEDNKWVVNDLSKDDINKIHGIYDYSNDETVKTNEDSKTDNTDHLDEKIED